MLLFLLVISVAQAKTVRYSNVPPRVSIATKTYDLEVPGSAPIRIIESEPFWGPEIIINTTPNPHELEHRGTKYKTGKDYFTTQPTKTTISEPVTHEPEHSTVYSADALNSFLKEYAEKLKADKNKFQEKNDESVNDESSNKLAHIYLDNEKTNNDKDYKDKANRWGSNNAQQYDNKYPFDDKKGWVSLEAIPWSTSKISKWQSNHKQEAKPWENNLHKPQTNWNTKLNNPFKNTYIETNYHSNPNNYNDNVGEYSNKYEEHLNTNDNIFMDKPVANYDVHIRPLQEFPSKPNLLERPQNNRPSYGYDVKPIKIKPENPDWPSEIPSKPSWSSRPDSHGPVLAHWSDHPKPDHWTDRNPNPLFLYGSHAHKGDNRDIITDGRPSDFPAKPIQNPITSYESPQEPPEGINSHPMNHPSNGNGEWVLVSTTKGYQYPRNKHQRSIEVTPESIGTRRGIRLTVLPPDNDSNINMTTSHGGLLEVESTFETVEESRNKFANASTVNMPIDYHMNKTKPTVNKIIKKPIRNHGFVAIRPSSVVHKRPENGGVKPGQVTTPANNIQDATAVLAAVGAGMVPATMAMLVPFVTGRKKRNIKDKTITMSTVIPNYIHNLQKVK